MQLKRDTDFALRIIFCLKQEAEQKRASQRSGLTLSEIASRTEVPKITAGRICDALEEGGLIAVLQTKDNAEKAYVFGDKLWRFSLLEVIEALESTGQLFSVFDQRSLMYQNCKESFSEVQEKVAAILKESSMERLLDTEKKSGRKKQRR